MATTAQGPTSGTSRTTRTVLLAVASLVAVNAAPLGLLFLLRLQHQLAYAGTCGPHAPDIPVHACSFETYMDEFGAGFAGIGLFIVEAAAFMGAVVFVAGIWLGGWLLGQRPRR